MTKPPNIAQGIVGLGVASVVTVVASEVSYIPIYAYCSGLGLARILGAGSPFGFVFGAILVFSGLLVVGLPIWFIYRRFGVSKLWQYAVTGIVFGILLASRVHAENYKEGDYHAWEIGEQTIHPIVDGVRYFLYGFLPFVVFWVYVYRNRANES